jgi:hypothetical protein
VRVWGVAEREWVAGVRVWEGKALVGRGWVVKGWEEGWGTLQEGVEGVRGRGSVGQVTGWVERGWVVVVVRALVVVVRGLSSATRPIRRTHTATGHPWVH